MRLGPFLTAERIRLWLRAGAWLALLAPFFYLTYGFANWVTSLRAGVPSIVFGWEHAIPFLAWTIVPYWSTNLLYGISLFVCTAREELDMHARRLLAVQVLCVAGFLLFPLRCTFTHPATGGVAGWLFDRLTSFDLPFNQAPSLHVAITVILWARFSAHMHGLWLVLLRGWLVLSALSTLTTFQHHFIDLPTGALVGWICLGLFSTQEADQGVRRGPGGPPHIAAIYGIGALLIGAAAVRLGSFAYVALWGAGALGFVSLVYAWRKPHWFGKRAEGMPILPVALLAPYMAGALLNSRLRARGGGMATEIVEGVWVGRALTRVERDGLGIRSVVDVAAELPVDTRGAVYRSVPMLDLAVPTREQIDAAVGAIVSLEDVRPTLVCCALGLSRSAVAVAEWLVASGRVGSVEEAVAVVRARRPQVVLRIPTLTGGARSAGST